MLVILNEVKNLIESISWKTEILRLTPQNDIATQSLMGGIKVGVMIRSFPPHPNPLPPGERVGHSSPQQSWGVFWHILINILAEP